MPAAAQYPAAPPPATAPWPAQAPGALPWSIRSGSGCVTRGPPTPGGAGPACGPLRAVIREYPDCWCIGGGCMVLRPSKSDPWVAPCVVLDGFSTLRLLWVAFRPEIETYRGYCRISDQNTPWSEARLKISLNTTNGEVKTIILVDAVHSYHSYNHLRRRLFDSSV